LLLLLLLLLLICVQPENKASKPFTPWGELGKQRPLKLIP